MQGMERAYDFHKLVICTNTLNQLIAIEYGDKGLQFARAHNKQRNVWFELYPLPEGQEKPNLANYLELTIDNEIILALKEGLKEPQGLLRILNMAPLIVAREKRWI